MKNCLDNSTYTPISRSFPFCRCSEKWRYSETNTTAIVEATVNEVVAKRMMKKQQMQLPAKGAHALLQTRTATLNGGLSQYFERWYPGFPVANDENHDQA